MKPGLRSRLLAAGFASTAFILPLAILLATRIPATTVRALSPAADLNKLLAVQVPELGYLRIQDTQSTHRIRFSVSDVGELLSSGEIRLLVADYGARTVLEVGELTLPDFNCTLRAAPGERFPNNALLGFYLAPGCHPPGPHTSGEARLTLQLRAPARPALWTSDAAAGNALVISDRTAPSGSGRAAVGFAINTDRARTERRLRLLAYVWQISPAFTWIVMALGGATMLIAFSAITLSSPGVIAGRRGPAPIFMSAAGAACLAGALSTTYAVLVPPFQAADEPNHFVGFVTLIGRPALAGDATLLASVGHFERIQFHAEQHFTPADMGVAGLFWNDGVAPEGLRGEGIRLLWQALAPLVRTFPAPLLLLSLRIANAAVFAAAIAVFVLLAGFFTTLRWPMLAALPLFLVPALAFFGMHVSNYAPLCAVYIVLAAGVLIQIANGPRAAFAGPVLGAAWACAIVLSRSSLPLAPLLAGAAAARFVRRLPSLRNALIYWIGLTAPVAVALAVADTAYLHTAVAMASRSLPGIGGAVLSVITARPWLMIAIGGGAGIAEWRLAKLRPEDAAISGWVGRACAAWAALLALLIMVSLAMSVFVSYPTLPAINPQSPPAPGVYVRTALWTMTTMFRVRHIDLFTVQSFWGGFGWLETLLPNPLVAVLITATGLALVATLGSMVRARAASDIAVVTLLLAGIAASIGLLALSIVSATPADLHGRYLIGVYLPLLVVCWSIVPRWVEGRTRAGNLVVLALSGCAVLALHIISYGIIVSRYF